MHRIAIIIPFFGTWPKWITLFFDSCRWNSTIDFFFFSDCDTSDFKSKDIPNIFFYDIGFGDYCDMVSQRLGINFHPTSAYKLCDLKPFYGMIHSDILVNYDFWGFGDIDLVFGDLRSFFTETLFGRYDILSNHSDRISGHLAFIRNTKELNALPFTIPNWKRQLELDQHYALDEIAFTKRVYPSAVFLWKVHKHIFFRFRFRDEFKSYNHFCAFFNRLMLPRRLHFQERYTTPWFGEGDVSNPEVVNGYQWKLENGHIFDSHYGIEIPYLHFLSLKKHWPSDCFHVETPCADAIINLAGFHHV